VGGCVVCGRKVARGFRQKGIRCRDVQFVNIGREMAIQGGVCMCRGGWLEITVPWTDSKQGRDQMGCHPDGIEMWTRISRINSRGLQTCTGLESKAGIRWDARPFREWRRVCEKSDQPSGSEARAQRQ
jgi:hypothetical protein